MRMLFYIQVRYPEACAVQTWKRASKPSLPLQSWEASPQHFRGGRASVMPVHWSPFPALTTQPQSVVEGTGKPLKPSYSQHKERGQLTGHHSLPLPPDLFYSPIGTVCTATRLSAAAIGNRTQPERGIGWQNLTGTPRSCPGETQLASGSDQTGTRQEGS